MTTLKPQVWDSGRRVVIIGHYKLVQMTAQHPNRNGLRAVRNIDETWGNDWTGNTEWGVQTMGVEQL